MCRASSPTSSGGGTGIHLRSLSHVYRRAKLLRIAGSCPSLILVLMIVRVTWDSSVVVLLGGMLEYESVSKSGTRVDWSRGSFGYIGVLWFCLSLILLMISPNPVYLSDSVSFCSRVRILLTRTSMSSVTFFLLSKVMRSSIPRLICWVDSCILFL